MGFFKSVRGTRSDKSGGPGSSSHEANISNSGRLEDKYDPPPGPPPPRAAGSDSSYAPPAGPPPSYRPSEYAPPPGPPPRTEGSEYAPPSGPPPQFSTSEYAPPPGPPPQASSASAAPEPYHDWTSVPDNALLPPPPSIGHLASPTGNAEESDAVRAHQWCLRYPLVSPHKPTNEQHSAAGNGLVALQRPREYNGSVAGKGPGSWQGSTKPGSKESCLLTAVPLYFAMVDSPFRTEASKTTYFEVKVKSFGRGRGQDEAAVAVGFCAVPYPTWRMPGWERGSLAVHSDDGRRYVNDTEGGFDFTLPFKAGETIGIGITYSIPEAAPGYAPSPKQGTALNGEVFLTRNGRRDGGWSLQEELDSEHEWGVHGVDGRFDLYGAVGVFGEVSFEAFFNRRDWLWQPE